MDWLPAATRAPGPAFLSWATTANPKGLLHTTEGGGWSSYNGWTEAPHATILPIPGVGVQVRQHIPFSQAAMGLVHSGTPETNRAYVFQFELVGTCAGTAGLYDWTHADDAVLADLYRKVIDPLSMAFRIPIRALQFQAYPDSYGPRGVTNTVRLSSTEWLAYSGWMGHQHAVESLHGDPGAFPWDRMTATAGGDMPTADEVARAVWAFPWSTGVGKPPELAQDRLVQAARGAGLADDVVSLGAKLDALLARAAAPVDVNALAAAIVAKLPTGSTVDVQAIASAVATELATRLVR